MPRNRFLLRALLTLATIGLPVVLSSSPAHAADPVWRIWSHSTHKCVDVPNGTPGNNVVIVQYTCNGADNQRWVQTYKKSVSEGGASATRYYQFKNVMTGKCLTVRNAATGNNVEIITYTCNGGDNQLWATDYFGPETPTLDDLYWVRNLNSNRCLAVQNNSPSNNAKLVQWSCNTGGNELWTWKP